ncbi:MAG: hypothetical protein IPP04_17255 [Saprospiraceae bacterium]|nr:hypothetical protein [Saprospiraceae bacterium]
MPIIKKLLVSHEQPGLAWLARLEKKYPGDTLVQDAIIKTISGHETAYLKTYPGLSKDPGGDGRKKEKLAGSTSENGSAGYAVF